MILYYVLLFLYCNYSNLAQPSILYVKHSKENQQILANSIFGGYNKCFVLVF